MAPTPCTWCSCVWAVLIASWTHWCTTLDRPSARNNCPVRSHVGTPESAAAAATAAAAARPPVTTEEI